MTLLNIVCNMQNMQNNMHGLGKEASDPVSDEAQQARDRDSRSR